MWGFAPHLSFLFVIFKGKRILLILTSKTNMGVQTKDSAAFIKESFLNFMRQNGFKHINSDTLLSPTFKTTFTISGGPNFTEKYLANDTGLTENTVVVQRCLRPWDIENVGDKKHLSFFYMLVTNSFEGFSRKEIFKFHHDYLTEILKLKKENIYCTVFKGGYEKGHYFPEDKDAIQILHNLNFKTEQIVLLDGSANFVANTVEPVGGPRVEFFYKNETKPDCDNCIPGICECGKYTEFWTHVLYNIYVNCEKNEEKYYFRPIEHKTLAAGFGLERLSLLLENKEDILEIDDISRIAEIFKSKLFAKGTYNEIYESDIKKLSEYFRGLIYLVFDKVESLSNKNYRGKVSIYRKFAGEVFDLLEKINLGSNSDLLHLLEQIIDLYRKSDNELYLTKEYIIQKIKHRKKQYLNSKK